MCSNCCNIFSLLKVGPAFIKACHFYKKASGCAPTFVTFSHCLKSLNALLLYYTVQVCHCYKKVNVRAPTFITIFTNMVLREEKNLLPGNHFSPLPF